MSKEAMKLALEVMQNQGDVSVDEWIAAEKALQKALANEALDKMAENERELGIQMQPTEWLTGCPSCGMDSCDCDEGTYNPQAQQEPVAYLCESAVGHKYFRWKKTTSHYKPIPLYTAPPKREWVGLTDDELEEYSKWFGGKNVVKAIEDKLKEKNDTINS